MRQSITGNTTFIKKTVLPITKQAGIKKVSVKVLPAQLPDDKEKMEVSFDTDKGTNDKLLDLLKKKIGKKGSTKRKKLNLTVYNEANASVIRKKLLKQFGGDPLYRDFILAKTPKEQRKALDTLKSIRGDVGVRLMQKYVKKLQAESVTDVKAILNENPAAAAAAAMTTVMLMNKETGRKNKAISALRDKDNPSHGKAVGIFKRLKDKFAKSKGKKDFEKQKKAVSKGAADYVRKLDKESVSEGFTKYHIRLTKTPGWYGVWDKKGKQKFEGDRKFVTKHLKKLKTRMGNFQLKSLIDVATKKKGKNIEFDVVESVNERIDKRQAAETLKQLGGNKFIAMTGAKNFGFGSKGMVFKIGRNSKGVNYVRIDLRNDLYDMEFIQMRAGKEKIKSKIKGVYNDQLQKIFTKHTGMYTRL